MSAVRRAVLAAAGALVLWAGAAAAADLRISIDTPLDGSVTPAPSRTVTLRGHVRVGEFTPPPSDVILLIDTSEDSAASSGADLDGDGRVSPGQGLGLSRWGVPVFRFRRGGDSILAAEILAARRIADAWPGAGARIGIVVIASPYDPHPCEHGPKGPGARIVLPLTPDRHLVSSALDRIANERPRGASNLAEGIRLSVSMLAGLPGTASAARPGVERLIVFLGYRAPTYPFGSPFHTAPEDIRLAEDAARAVGNAGIRMEGFAFGTGRGKALGSLEAILALAGGRLLRVTDPRQASFDPGGATAGVTLRVVNESTGRPPVEVIPAPDGSWRTAVPVARGENRIRVRARAADGTETERVVVLRAR